MPPVEVISLLSDSDEDSDAEALPPSLAGVSDSQRRAKLRNLHSSITRLSGQQGSVRPQKAQEPVSRRSPKVSAQTSSKKYKSRPRDNAGHDGKWSTSFAKANGSQSRQTATGKSGIQASKAQLASYSQDRDLDISASSTVEDHHGLTFPGPSEEIQAQTTLAAIEEVLNDVRNEIMQSHATFVHYMLESASNISRELQSQMSLNSRPEKISPFSSLQSVEQPVLAGSSEQNTMIARQYSLKKGITTRSTIPLILRRSGAERVPKHEYYVEIDSNVLVSDQTKLGFTPFFGDDHFGNDSDGEARREAQQKELRDSYDIKLNTDPWHVRRIDLARTLNHHLPSMLDNLSISLADLRLAMQPLVTTSQAIKDFIRQFNNVFDVDMSFIPFEEDTRQLVIGHNQASPSIQPDHDTSCAELIVAESEDYKSIRGRFLQQACIVCHQFNCHIHGEFVEVEGSESAAVVVYENLSFDHEHVLARGIPESKMKEKLEPTVVRGMKPCSQDCYLESDLETHASIRGWSAAETAQLLMFAEPFSTEVRTPCALWPLFREHNRSCADIHKKLASLPSIQPTMNNATPRASRGPRWYDSKRKRVILDDFGSMTKTHRHDVRSSLKGCYHPGESCAAAKDNCDCYKDEVLCERHCSCTSDCRMRFTGCNCQENTCRTSACPCFLLNRECQPDLCLPCGARAAADRCGEPSNIAHLCHNIALQRGMPKTLLVGQSSIPGHENGLYIAEACSKDDFIAEYVGEIVSFDESERRWHIYNEKNLKYLFTLNNDWVIDAARYGNKTRFINHSCNPNVVAKVVLVNMVHRIGFWALQDIKAGQELFFDYGTDFPLDNHRLESADLDQSKCKKEKKQATKSIKTNSTNTIKSSSERGLRGSSSPQKRPDWQRIYVRDLEDDEDEDCVGELFTVPRMTTTRRQPGKRVTRLPRKYTR